MSARSQSSVGPGVTSGDASGERVDIPHALTRDLEEYLAFLRVERGSSHNTIAAYRRDLVGWSRWLVGERGIGDFTDVRRDDVEAYAAYLHLQGRAASSVERALSAIKGLHRFLYSEGFSPTLPTSEVRLPKKPERLPDVISIDQAFELLDQPFPPTAAGLRDKTMLEVLYGCGLRVSELTGLDVSEVFLGEGFLRVFGKGSKERLVPLVGTAASTLAQYLRDARPLLCRAPHTPADRDTPAVFLNARGGRISRQSVYHVVERCGVAVGIAHLHPTHAAPLVCDAHARRRGRPARGAGDPGPLGHLDDADLHARRSRAYTRRVFLGSSRAHRNA